MLMSKYGCIFLVEVSIHYHVDLSSCHISELSRRPNCKFFRHVIKTFFVSNLSGVGVLMLVHQIHFIFLYPSFRMRVIIENKISKLISNINYLKQSIYFKFFVFQTIFRKDFSKNYAAR